jgi:hypothetical protein
MAQHRLLLNAAQLELTSKDIEIVVFNNKERMGTLKVSKGSLDWRDKKDRKSHVARWEGFRQWIIGQNRRRLRRK